MTIAEFVLEFEVHGVPQPKGSLIPIVTKATGRVWMKESNLDKLDHWRSLVRYEALMACNRLALMRPRYGGPVLLELSFWLVPPKNVGPIRKALSAIGVFPLSLLCIHKPDVDKLARTILDVLKDSGVYLDDAQVVDLIARKRYVSPAHTWPGAKIKLVAIEEDLTIALSKAV